MYTTLFEDSIPSMQKDKQLDMNWQRSKNQAIHTTSNNNSIYIYIIERKEPQEGMGKHQHATNIVISSDFGHNILCDTEFDPSVIYMYTITNIVIILITM